MTECTTDYRVQNISPLPTIRPVSRTYITVLRGRFSTLYRELQLTGDENGEVNVNLDCLMLDILQIVGMMDQSSGPADVRYILDI